jgi:hypothetical protein
MPQDETQSLLLQLPRELLFAVLMCLSSPTRPARSYYESAVLNLAARRQEAVEAVANARLTCSALFVASEASGVTRDAVVGHLAAWTSALMSRLTPTPSEEDSTLAITAMEEELSSSTTEGDAELLGVSVAAQALRASVVVAGRRIPSSVINMVEKGFDPGANRYACFITARTVTDLPAALAVVAGWLFLASCSHAVVFDLSSSGRRGTVERGGDESLWHAPGLGPAS